MDSLPLKTTDVWDLCAEYVWELSLVMGLSQEETRELAHGVASKLSERVTLNEKEEGK